MTLILVGDSSTPPDAPHLLPSGMRKFLGYLGGDTPHAWSRADVAALEDALGPDSWAGIWTAPNGSSLPPAGLTAAIGTQCAEGAVAALQALARPAWLPVFLDIEQGAYARNPAGAMTCRAAFVAVLAAHGYPRAYAYLPKSAGVDWIAAWQPAPPTVLGLGVVGQQYAGNVPTPAGVVDLSMFEPAIFLEPEPDPAPSPIPVNLEEFPMGLIVTLGNAQWWVTPSGTRIVCAVQSDVSALIAAGAVKQQLSAAMMAAIPDVTVRPTPSS